MPRNILSDNGTEIKNHLMDQELKQLGIEHTFSTPYHPQSNGKLEVFHKYLKPTLKKLCEKDPSNWDKYINQVLTSYSDIKPCHSWNTICLGLWKRPQLTLTPTSGTHAMILRRSGIWIIQLGCTPSSPSHCYEDSRWKPIQKCSENDRQRTTIIQDRW